VATSSSHRSKATSPNSPSKSVDGCGDGRLNRNVNIAEVRNGEAVKVTDYWGEPTTTPQWRLPLTDRLDMPADGIWKDTQHLGHY
jgi:hypothetical protein